MIHLIAIMVALSGQPDPATLVTMDNIPETTSRELTPLTADGSIIIDRTIDKPFRKYTSYKWKYSDISAEITCLAENIYFESRGQGEIGQIGVALVTINRVKSRKFPNSICSNVWKKNEDIRTRTKDENGDGIPGTGTMVAQFSWTIDGNSNTPKKGPSWRSAKRLASKALKGGSLDNFYDFTSGSTYFHNRRANPYWSKEFDLKFVFEGHLMYADPNDFTIPGQSITKI